MSRFWAGAGSSSDSDSESDDSYSSTDSEDVGRAATRWNVDSDSDSSDEARVVKSAKDRALETFTAHIKAIRNAMKIKDNKTIGDQFDDLSKAMIKAKKVLAAGVPRKLVRILCDLEDYVKENLADKAAFKKLTPGQGRALNRLKLTLKKHNKPYSAVMAAYRKNPIEDDSDDESSSDDSDSDSDDSDDDSDSSGSSESDDDSDDVPKKKAATKDSDSDSSDSDSDSDSDDSDSDDGDSDDSEEWGSSSDSSSDDSDGGGDLSQLKGRARWLKKPDENKKRKEKPEVGVGGKKPGVRDGGKGQGDAGAKAMESSKAVKSVLDPETLTAAVLLKKVHELVLSRGRRGTDNRQVLRQLEALSKLSLPFGPRVEVPILMNVVTAQFDLQRTMDDYMPTKTWKSCANYLDRVSDVLDEGYRLGQASLEQAQESVSAGLGKNKMKAAANASDGAMAAVAADEELVNPHTGGKETRDERAERLRLEKEEAMTDEEKKVIPVFGSYARFLSRLEEEYVKSLQHISPHSSDYVTRLRDESKLVDLLTKGQAYYAREDMPAEAASLAQLRVEHIYYRHDTIGEQVDKAAAFYKKFGEMDMLHPACVTEASSGSSEYTHPGAACGLPSVGQSTKETPTRELLDDLCTFVYKHGTDRAKTRAMICHIYYHALHSRFLEARDLLLMSHLQETIVNSGDVATMILFNRMMVTLGMAAFRLGNIWSAHQCLSEICSGRVRELLAQGVSTGRMFNHDKSAEQEKAEKRRQVPYHQHINLDLLEACHLISAMLLEVPNMAAASEDRRARVISRTFRKHHDIYDRQVFTGPPEQTRDFVMRAAKALRKGDWKTCADYVTTMEVWKLVPGEGVAEAIKKMLVEKTKLEGLRTYLFAFAAESYDSLSLNTLCGMFEMTKNEVHSVVSKMMINRELYASWDQPTETIVLRKVEPSSLQVMALQFAEKAANLVEANERLLDAQSGSYGYRDGDGDYRDGRYRGPRHGHDRRHGKYGGRNVRNRSKGHHN